MNITDFLNTMELTPELSHCVVCIEDSFLLKKYAFARINILLVKSVVLTQVPRLKPKKNLLSTLVVCQNML